MSDEKLPQRTLRTGFFLAGWFVVIFYLRGWHTASMGLALGSALSLFSLWSLSLAIPIITHESRGIAKVLVVLLLVFKLPLYACVLYFATTRPYFHLGAVVAGIALVPVVIVLKVLGRALVDRVREPGGEESCRSNSSKSN